MTKGEFKKNMLFCKLYDSWRYMLHDFLIIGKVQKPEKNAQKKREKIVNT